MKKLVVVEAFELPAVDVRRMLEVCEYLKTSKDASGHQRDELEGVIDELEFYLSAQEGGMVLVPADLFAREQKITFDLMFKARHD